MQTHDRAATASVRRLFHTLDVPPPGPVAEAFDRHDTITTGIDNIAVGNLARLVTDALIDGRDPTTDPDVQRAVTANAVTDAKPSIVSAAMDRLTTTILDQSDQIIEAWRDPFNRAAADLHAAYEVLGDIDLTDTDTIVRLGPDATAAWAKATTATTTVNLCVDGWHTLRILTRGMGDVRRDHRVLVMAHVDGAAILDGTLGDRQPDPWEIVRGGWTLSLATPDELNERVAAIATERDRRATAVEANRKRAALA